MFDIGVACLWLDATEPENFPNENVEAYLASGNALFNRLECAAPPNKHTHILLIFVVLNTVAN